MGFKVHYPDERGDIVTEHFDTVTDTCARVSALLSPAVPPTVFVVSDEGADYSMEDLTRLSLRASGHA